MSRMHHRRAGYPFGSLIDFATDSMGRKLLIFVMLTFGISMACVIVNITIRC